MDSIHSSVHFKRSLLFYYSFAVVVMYKFAAALPIALPSQYSRPIWVHLYSTRAPRCWRVRVHTHVKEDYYTTNRSWALNTHTKTTKNGPRSDNAETDDPTGCAHPKKRKERRKKDYTCTVGSSTAGCSSGFNPTTVFIHALWIQSIVKSGFPFYVMSLQMNK